VNDVRSAEPAEGDLFEPLDDQPAYRQIAKLIEQRIVGGGLRAGDALPSESDLARQFGVNRSTVREAIRELESHGLLGRGRGEKRLRVTRPEAQHVSKGVSRALIMNDVTYLELWEAMMAIEPAAAQYAAARRTAAQLQAIVRTSTHFRRDAADTAAAVAAVLDFFNAVAAASGNQVLALAQAPLNGLLAPALTEIIERVPQARARIGEAQSRITNAVKRQQRELARTWMEKHIRDFKRGYELAFPHPDIAGLGMKETLD
jgi:GntR family transcriptional regulator, transcriptional repressor for pyruvate dehydrogenase complex